MSQFSRLSSSPNDNSDLVTPIDNSDSTALIDNSGFAALIYSYSVAPTGSETYTVNKECIFFI